MSRFFATGSESESESSSSEEEPIPQKAQGITGAFTFSDEEEETKRVVRSAREKRYEELIEIIKLIKNHKKIKDMSKLWTSFENLTRAFTKARPVIEKEENGNIPKFYIRCLVELEDFITDCWEDKEGRKNMSKNNSKFLATLRQKLRKYNKDFETEIANYRKNPDAEDEEREDEEEQESDDDEEKTVDFFKKPQKAEKEEPKSKLLKGSDDEESDDDSIDWGSSSEEESSLSTDDEKYGGNLATKFLKRPGEKDEQKEITKREKKRDKERRERKRDDDDEGWEEVKGGAPIIMEKPKMFAKDAEINHQVVLKKFNEILAARGKKGTDRSEQIDLLIELLNVCETHNLGSGILLKIMFAIIAAIFDYNPNIATCMKGDMWQKCLDYINMLLDILIENPNIVVGEHIAEESEQLITPPYRVKGCCLTVVERMDEEFTKMLQGCDAHSPEYVERLKDETVVCNIIERLQNYLEGRGTPSELCRIYLRRIEHLYYKFDTRVFKKKEKMGYSTAFNGTVNGTINGNVSAENEGKEEEETSADLITKLCKFICAKDTTDRIRTQATLFRIYHLALHDEWFHARDLLLMSHLQNTIEHSDITTMIIYNRALVQLGLCAFRHGFIKDAHAALLDIQSGGRAKELLAQGLLPQRQHERTPDQEKIEKRRQIPFHKHINLELLECVYLVSAMLLEIPYMAAHELEGRRRMISKSFHHQLRNSERQALVGPPESMREHVVAASKAMRVGNWKACKDYIINEKMNSKVWDLFHQAEKVREMISQKIQEEALRTYLFTYSSYYDSLSVARLSEMFELDKGVVHSILCKMIINEELMASLDEPTQSVILHRTEPSRIQALSLQLADKVSSLVEQNERLMDLKQGSYFSRNIGQQSGTRDSTFQKSNYGQQDRNWNRRTNQRNY
ncbi:eukaryotic translation initiation factor 3 subunit C-like [Stegodyphus dumicola]|uniref:eukaryotic translation initiation factor 3 subunit C-like n=1 Tax=Stegodyphus dumicola TaxID=202533 RepID=UPI0015AE41E9|nr:eukaryotic translation initiation factor 3 subunit C-like [Stegodyphus dumicola]